MGDWVQRPQISERRRTPVASTYSQMILCIAGKTVEVVHNAWNLLIIRDSELAKRYTENWKKHAGHGEIYAGK